MNTHTYIHTEWTFFLLTMWVFKVCIKLHHLYLSVCMPCPSYLCERSKAVLRLHGQCILATRQYKSPPSLPEAEDEPGGGGVCIYLFVSVELNSIYYYSCFLTSRFFSITNWESDRMQNILVQTSGSAFRPHDSQWMEALFNSVWHHHISVLAVIISNISITASITNKLRSRNTNYEYSLIWI